MFLSSVYVFNKCWQEKYYFTFYTVNNMYWCHRRAPPVWYLSEDPLAVRLIYLGKLCSVPAVWEPRPPQWRETKETEGAPAWWEPGGQWGSLVVCWEHGDVLPAPGDGSAPWLAGDSSQETLGQSAPPRAQVEGKVWVKPSWGGEEGEASLGSWQNIQKLHYPPPHHSTASAGSLW